MVLTNLEKADNEQISQNCRLGLYEARLQRTPTSQPTQIEVQFYVNKIQALQREILETHQKILNCTPVNVDQYNQIYGTMFERIVALTCGFRQLIITPISSGSGTNVPDIRLPRMELPSFSGELNEWMSFKDMFDTAVHLNTKLSSSQKLTYLKSALTGDAAKLLRSIQVTDSNYQMAWYLLIQRYQNERELVFSILRKFITHPTMSVESAVALFSLVDISKECLRSLETLGVPVEHWDVIIVFLILQKVDATTRQFWELSLANTSIPKLNAFVEFLEQRGRALASGVICKPSTHGKPPHDSRISVNPTKRTVAHHVKQSTCKHKSTSQNSDETLSAAVNTYHINHDTKIGQGMLATAVIKVMDKSYQPQLCRAFLDSGSTTSFISDACVRRLGLIRHRNSTEVIGISSVSAVKAKGSITIEFGSHFSTPDMQRYSVTMLILQSITSDLPTQKANPEHWPHLAKLQLADPSYGKPAKIDIHLGSDVFWDLLLDEKRTGPRGTPIGMLSKLGCLIAGNLTPETIQVVAHHVETNLEHQLQQFWEIESIPSTRVYTLEEQKCEDQFTSASKRDATGRFIVSLPFKEEHSKFGTSRNMAVRRLLSLERRLNSNPQHKQQYLDFMRDYSALGHMELIRTQEEQRDATDPTLVSPTKSSTQINISPVYYIPHHYVLKESNTTTKFRVVFDASAKTSSGESLNEKLMVGPTHQDSLINILIRFRTHVIAFNADIAKMYRQVLMNTSDTDCQRIVWRYDPKEDIQDYRLLTVTYGTASAPYHATRSLNQLAHDEQHLFPLAFSVVKNDFYVDDFMSGAPTVEEAIEIQIQLLGLTRRGGFDLRKCTSNHAAVLAVSNPSLREVQLPLRLDKEEVVKTHGLIWNPGTDTFTFKVHLPVLKFGVIITKRALLSEMSKVFDPLGWLSPVTIRAKIFFQQLWKTNTNWDDPLPNDILQAWIMYRGHLHHIEVLAIQRCIRPLNASRFSLHGFCDSSEQAFAAVVYMRVEQPNQEPTVSLISAKTRVAPTKQISLPRLELCGAVLLSKLMETVHKALKIECQHIHLWTDSTVVLS